MSNRLLGVLFSGLVSAGILWLVARDLDWNAAAAAMRQMPAASVVTAAVLIGVSLVARGVRWHYLLCARLPIARSLHLTILAFLINNILPFRAGDLFRIEAAARSYPPIPRTTALSVAVVERLLDLLTIVILFFLAVTGLQTIPETLRQGVMVAGVAFAVISLVLAALLTFFQSTAAQIIGRVEQRVNMPLRKAFDDTLQGLDVIRRPGYLLVVLVANGFAWGGLVAAYHLLIHTLFPGAGAAVSVLLIVAVALAITVPTTIASIGIIEGSAILALTSQNYPYDEAFAIGVMVHLCTLGSYTVLGLVSIWATTVLIQPQKEIAS